MAPVVKTLLCLPRFVGCRGGAYCASNTPLWQELESVLAHTLSDRAPAAVTGWDPRADNWAARPLGVLYKFQYDVCAAWRVSLGGVAHVVCALCQVLHAEASLLEAYEQV